MIETFPAPLLEHDFHVEARMVVDLSPEPQNAFEVAVTLSTLGDGDSTAARYGCTDLFDLARRVHAVVPMYRRQPAEDAAPETAWHRRRRRAGYLVQGFAHVQVWVLALVLLFWNRAAFWSGTTLTIPQSTAIGLALVVSTVLTAPVIQAYSRRHVFYALQGNMPLARWATSRILHAGGLVVLLAILASYVVLEHVLHALTPDTTVLYLCFALLLASAQLALTPLLAAGDGWGVFGAALAGAAVLLWLRPTSWTALVDVEGLFRAQAAAIAVILAVAMLAAWLRQRAQEATYRALPDRALAPRWLPVSVSVLPYSLYGVLIFLLVFGPKLVAGGLLHGAYHYEPVFEGTADIAVLLLVPALIAMTAMSEGFRPALRDAIHDLRVDEVATFRQRVVRQAARRLVVLLVVLGTCSALLWLVTVRGPRLLPVDAPSHLMPATLAAFALLAVGLACGQLLFVLEQPLLALSGMVGGFLTFLAVAAPVGAVASPPTGALVGLLAGATVAATSAGVTLLRVARRADWAVYAGL